MSCALTINLCTFFMGRVVNGPMMSNWSMDGSEFHHFWVDRPMTRPMAVSSWFNPSKRRFALVCHDWCPGREAPGPSRRRYVCNGSVNEGHSLKGVLAKRAGNCWDAMLLHLMLRYAWCANFWGKRFSMANESTPGLSCAGQPLVMRKPHQRLRRLLRLFETGETGEPIMEDVGGSVSNISRYGKVALEAMG